MVTAEPLEVGTAQRSQAWRPSHHALPRPLSHLHPPKLVCRASDCSRVPSKARVKWSPPCLCLKQVGTCQFRAVITTHYRDETERTVPGAPGRIGRQSPTLPLVSEVAHLVSFPLAGFPEGSQGYRLGSPCRRTRPGESPLPSQCRFL